MGPYLTRFGNEEQCERFLPKCVSGECVLAIAMTEPDAGSDLAGIRTTAVEEGDHWVLNGSKTFISNGINADLVIVEQGLSSAEGVVDHFVERLLQRSIEPARRKSLIEVLERKIDARSVSRPSNADGIRALIHLILSMPEYQLS